MPYDFWAARPALFLLVVGEREDLVKLVGLHVSDMPEVEGLMVKPAIRMRKEHRPGVTGMIHRIAGLGGRLRHRETPFLDGAQGRRH